ncbi:hypothetical protein [Neorhizobium sp. T7_12]|uniref:hypothetical protein n=1 Tax=Neorhizobium sp. T7_12 TaxID=2093832 RepID=UPI000CF8436A|nr:hypothetical protein [Neorhizobium sp. T7_12]
MNSYKKFAASTRANFTDEELKKAQSNWDYVARRFPEEHREAESLIAARGLSGHREITAHYLANKSPITSSEIKRLETYAQSTYEGPFGRGKQGE